jgi:hypothetical protein
VNIPLVASADQPAPGKTGRPSRGPLNSVSICNF